MILELFSRGWTTAQPWAANLVLFFGLDCALPAAGRRLDNMAAMNQLSNPDVNDLLRHAVGGDQSAWGRLLLAHENRLTRMVKLRLDPRLNGRVDAADVVQEAFVQATKRRAEYFELDSMPFFIWLRLISMQKLAELHRHHLGVKARDAARDVSLFSLPPATSAVLAAHLLGQTTTPSQQVARDEIEQRVRHVLDGMEQIDREIIALRNFEQLSNIEAASVIGIGASTASSRYIRALKKLKAILGDMPAFDDS